MRPLEIAIILCSLPLLVVWLFRIPTPVWGKWIPVVALAIVAVHLVVEGARLQLVPAYLLAGILFVAAIWPAIAQPGRIAAIAGICLVLSSAILGTVFPVFSLPRPTGSFSIGTAKGHLIDESRQETQGSDPHGPRELVIQVWYPADQAGPSEPYRTSAEAWLQGQHRLSLVRTHASHGVPVAQAPSKFPVLIFAPSWGGQHHQNTVQAEELASHGFVVVGINHPYSSEMTVFPDGRVIRRTLGEWLDCASDSTFKECVRVAEDQLRIRTADVRFVLDELENLTPTVAGVGILHDRIDLSRVGVFGHSFGGAVTAEVCRTDSRVKAGVNYDGAIFGPPVREGFGKPFLFMCDDSVIPTAADVDRAAGARRRRLAFDLQTTECLRRGLSKVNGCWVTVHGAKHCNFCDDALFSPVRRMSHAGSIPPSRAMKIVNAFTLAFFTKHLLDQKDRLLDDRQNNFEEVSLEQFSSSPLSVDR